MAERQKYDYSDPTHLQLCIFKEKGIHNNTVTDLLNAWRDELALYQIDIKLAKVTTWQRKSFFSEGIYQNLLRIPLRKPCDRMLILVDPKLADFIWELFAPVTILGVVDGNTHSRGYIIAKYYSLNQIFGASPKATLVHEGYHLLGCGHALFLTKCYKQIYNLKFLHKMNKRLGNSFLPALREDGFSFLTREEVNNYLKNKTKPQN
ncbi:MAG: hypothetical protein AAF518_28975 [Spirochaetota bacterium]